MSTSAFYSGDDITTRTLECPGSATSKDAILTVYEIDRCFTWIKNSDFKRVSLQFPDVLLVDAPAVASELQSRLPDTSIFILGDTSYGSCCVDEVGAEHYRADCVIHFGRACLSPTVRIPVLYVFGRSPIDPDDCATKIQEVGLGQEVKAVLVYDTTYSYAADDVFNKLKPLFPNLVLSRLADPSTALEKSTTDNCTTDDPPDRKSKSAAISNMDSVTKCKCGRVIPILEESSLDDYIFLFIGTSDSPALLSMMMTLNKNTFYAYDPLKNCKWQKETVNVNRALMKRYYLIERVKDSSIVGIVAGTLGVSRYRDMIEQLKNLLKSAGKKTYMFAVGKLNPAKLANFAEVDVFVLVSCPESSVLGQEGLYRPVVSPLEAEMACNQAREWTGEYSTDFRDLLSGGSNYIEAPAFKENDGVDVSLISNKIRTLGTQESIEVGSISPQTVAVRSEATAVANIAKDAGEFLHSRSWQGLEKKLGETPVEKAKEGRFGIAASYSEEPGT